MMEIVYSAFGRRYVMEAAISAASAKRHMPNVPISLTTDQCIESPVFDRIKIVERCPDGEDPTRFAKFHKASAILDSAADRVLYLDADTYVAADLTPAFSVLDQSDIGVAHDTWRMTEVYRKLHPSVALPDEPCWKTYFNTGVILIRKSAPVEKLIDNWIGAFAAERHLLREQIVFQRLIYDAGLRLHVLPGELNLRAGEPVQISGPVMILHRLCNPQADAHWPSSSAFLSDFLNSCHSNRVYTPHDGRMVILTTDFRREERYLQEHQASSEKEEFILPNISFCTDVQRTP